MFAPPQIQQDFLRGGGEMGALMRAHDWRSTPLGDPSGWPPSLRTTLRILLTSNHPMFVWWGPDLIQFYNDAYSQTMGAERHPSALGARGRDCWAEIWPIIGPQIDQVMAGGGATWNEDQLVPVTRNGRLEQVWWTYGYSPIEGDGDKVEGVLVICNDVTASRQAEQQRQLLTDELQHRVKNTLAMAQAIVSQTLRRGADVAEARSVIAGRLAAMGHAHDVLIRKNWSAAPLRDVIEGSVAVHDPARERVRIDGPQTKLGASAALALSLAFHELCTNATKYGALSTEDGRVEIAWAHDGERLRLTWAERGGPQVEAPSRKGFGSRLTGDNLERDFGGAAALAFEPAGLVWTFEAPLDRLEG